MTDQLLALSSSKGTIIAGQQPESRFGLHLQGCRHNSRICCWSSIFCRYTR